LSLGKIYGPAFDARFLLAKTEDVSSETPIEEDSSLFLLFVESINRETLKKSWVLID
jgi:hypothetical protein